MNALIPEDISKAASLRSESLPSGKFPAEVLSVQHFPAGGPVPRGSSIRAWPKADAAVIATQAPLAQGLRADLVQSWDSPLDRTPNLRAYRRRTVTMLRRYLRYSLKTGRVPSLLGGEYFRTGVTSYGVVTFEDRVFFVHDMETCRQRLGDFSLQLIARYTLQEHDLPATARLLHCNEKTIRQAIPVVLDQLGEILPEVGWLEKMNSMEENSCPGGPGRPNPRK